MKQIKTLLIAINSKEYLDDPNNATATFSFLAKLFKFVKINYLTAPLDLALIGIFDEFLSNAIAIKNFLFQSSLTNAVDDENETFAFFAATGKKGFKRWQHIDRQKLQQGQQDATVSPNYTHLGQNGFHFTTHLLLLDKFRQTYLNPTIIPQDYFISLFSPDYSPRFSMKTIEHKLKPYLLVCCLTSFSSSLL